MGGLLSGAVFGVLPSVSQVLDLVCQLWGRRDLVDAWRLDSGFFFFRFENPQTRD